MPSRKSEIKNREEKPVRSIDETLDFLRTASRITATRLDSLNNNNAHEWQIERIKQRLQLILETIKAVEEACSMNA